MGPERNPKTTRLLGLFWITRNPRLLRAGLGHNYAIQSIEQRGSSQIFNFTVLSSRKQIKGSMPPVAPRSGDAIFANVERVNAELFTLTYGAIVRQLLTDLEEVEEVNKQLDQMGYNIGIRLVDEFLAKSNVSRCVDFKETADVIAKVGFKMFLGVTASVTNWDADGTSCSFVLEDNPLVDFVELPDTCQGLYYCNILSGVIRGALEMVSMKTEVTWVRDMLRGDDAFELQVKLLKQVPEEYPYKDDE
ncbi:hypothetical protein L1049_000997 [Liquidambar formosana]|uniref:Trafficking protein particle complex subunit n=1 Tax=Liquidambar formosana TaxID=63359 RepID=A0AAP0NBL9_LIQFO